MGDHHPLISSQSTLAAQLEHTFDFLVDSADGLDFPLLIDRASDGYVLLQR